VRRLVGAPLLFSASRAIVRPMFKRLQHLQQLPLLLLSDCHARLRCAIAYTLYLLILILGSLPGARQEIGSVASGLILHSCAYAGLTFLLFTGSRGLPRQRALKAVLSIAAMGAFDEYVQSFFPYRHGSVGDWVVDCSAAVVTASVLWLLWQRLGPHQTSAGQIDSNSAAFCDRR